MALQPGRRGSFSARQDSFYYTDTAEDRMVTDVRTVDAKVLEVRPPYLTVMTGDKEIYVRVPEGTRFTINGKEMKLSDLHAGMQVQGTLVTAVPTTVAVRKTTVTGQAPKPVETPVLVRGAVDS